MSRSPLPGRRALILRLAALPVAGLAGACGFQPLYGAGTPARGMQGRVAVATLDGRDGFTLRERLTERLGPAVEPTHRLEVDLTLREVGAGITQQDVTTRFSVIGSARFRLIPGGATEPVLEETVEARTAYSAPAGETASAFAALSAQRDARQRLARVLADQIVLRLAVTAGDWSA